MKLVAFSLFAVLLLQASTAAPNPFFYDTIGGISQGVNEMVNTVRNITQGGINIATDIGSGITKNITGWTVNGIHAMEIFFQNVHHAVQEGINRLTNRVVVRVVEQVKSRLVDIEKRAQQLTAIAEEKLNDAKEKINNNIKKLQNDLYSWNDEQAQKAVEASEDIKSEINTLLDNFLESSLTEAQACGDSILVPIEDLHNQTKAAVENSYPLFDAIVTKIKDCAALDQRDNRKTSACAAEVKEKLEVLSPLLDQLLKLSSQFNRISINSLHRSLCVLGTYEKIEEEKRAVAAQIDELLKKDKSNQEIFLSTTKAADESTKAATDEFATRKTVEETTTEETTVRA